MKASKEFTACLIELILLKLRIFQFLIRICYLLYLIYSYFSLNFPLESCRGMFNASSAAAMNWLATQL